MTVTPQRRSANHWPGLDVLPTGPRARVSARIARTLFRDRGQPARRHRPRRRRDARPRRPVMVVQPARGVLPPARPRPADRLRRGLPHRRLGRRGPRRLPHRAGRPDAAPDPRAAPEAARARGAQAAGGRAAAAPRTRGSNIAHHYDLSNDLFELFLDPTLSYSSALFPTDRLDAVADPCDLEAAQVRKIDRLLDQAGVGDGTRRVLEIGSGWGELAIRAARRGATVRTITLSIEQKALADERIAAAGRRGPRRRSSSATTATVVGAVRRGRVGRDDRGGRLAVLADLLRDHRPGARARRPGRDPGDHDAARPDAGDPQHLHLDQQVHLPGRLPALGQGDRRDHPRHTAPAHGRPAVDGGVVRRDAAAVGRGASSPRRSRCSASASTRPSCGCGTSTWSTPEPASPPATSTSTSSPSRRAHDRHRDRLDRERRDGPRSRWSPGRGTAAVRRRRPAGPAAGVGRLRGGTGRRAAGRARTPPTPSAGCCGTRASSAPRRPTSPARSTSPATSTRR